jgi:hypothetical protein
VMKAKKIFSLATGFCILTSLTSVTAKEVTRGTGTDSGKTPASIPSGPSVNTAAKDAKSANKEGQTMSMIMSAGEFAQGYVLISEEQYVPGAILIGMGVMSMLQGQEHGSKAGQASLTAAKTNSFGGNGFEGSLSQDVLNEYPEIGEIPKILNRIKPGQNPNFSYDPKTGIIKAGDKTYKATDFSSPASMAAAGFPQGAIDGAAEFSAKLEKKVAERIKLGAFTETNGFAEGGGGGGGVVIQEEASMSSTSPGYGSGAGAGSDANAVGMAGMTKDYNGAPIGVASDSIFDMMTRRYNVKKQQDGFYSETEVLFHR